MPDLNEQRVRSFGVQHAREHFVQARRVGAEVCRQIGAPEARHAVGDEARVVAQNVRPVSEDRDVADRAEIRALERRADLGNRVGMNNALPSGFRSSPTG